jgi:hypothetical protein
MSALSTSDPDALLHIPPQPCWLTEPCGRLLTRGRCATHETADGIPRVEITDLEHPGQLVQRCLTGSVRTVWVHLEDGSRFLVQVEDVAYDPRTGRRCLLRHIAPGYAPGTNQGPE